MANTTRLINSTGDLKAGVGVIQTDLDFNAFASFVDDADMNDILPVIGYECYNSLCADDLSADKTTALNLLKKAGTNFALYYFSSIGSVQIAESGIFVTKDSRQLPASDKKIYMLRMQTISSAYVALESAVNFMESKLASFPEYAADTAHQQNRSYYINTTALFSQGFDLSGNSQVFSSLKTVMNTIEENYIDPLLGDDVSTELRSAITDGSTSLLQNQLLVRIAKAVAPLTIAEAIPYRLVDITASGLVTPTLKNNIENAEVTTEGGLQQLQDLMNKAQTRGLSELAKLKSWLANNITSFPDYVAPDPDASSKVNGQNWGFEYV